jgi:trimeric autotransporter adhesin
MAYIGPFPVKAINGGTAQTTYATGDILYASSANTLSKLAAGSNTQVLTLAAGVPSWASPTTGTVTSVSGTTNRITSTGGATPVIDISAAYVGQTSITTLGTVSTGTWQGTAIDATHGGTAQTTYATGDILYASAANTLSKLAAGSNTQVLTLAAGVPTWASPTTGTVTSVSGTTNRITSTGGATPVIDISASYVGQSSITTLGTIATGTWQGTNIDLAFGGTNASLTASNGGIFYSTASAGAILAGVATAGRLLRSGASTAPTWTTTTYPATNAINTLLYASAANVLSVTNALAGYGALVTNSSGVPNFLGTNNNSILSTDGSGSPGFNGSPTVSGTLTAGILTSSTSVTATTNFLLPTTTSTAGQLRINNVRFVHSFGTSNTFVGATAGNFTTSGSGGNTGIGSSALASIGTGVSNTCLGLNAGSSYTGSESSNICIMASGTAAESNVLRIGTNGSSTGQVSSCFIAGITGVTVTGTAVLCSATGQLGTVASSERYKENIVDMSDAVSVIHLRPIEFNYKEDSNKTKQYGLLAEDIDRDFPYLCFYNEDDQPESVKYHELCTLLLHEVKKLNARIEKLEQSK